MIYQVCLPNGGRFPPSDLYSHTVTGSYWLLIFHVDEVIFGL